MLCTLDVGLIRLQTFVGLLSALAALELLKLYPGSPVFLLDFAVSIISIGFLGL